jgi:hypothetical protein
MIRAPRLDGTWEYAIFLLGQIFRFTHSQIQLIPFEYYATGVAIYNIIRYSVANRF